MFDFIFFASFVRCQKSSGRVRYYIYNNTISSGRVRVLFKEKSDGDASVLPQCQLPGVVKCSFIKVNRLFKRIKKKNMGKRFEIMDGIKVQLKAILKFLFKMHKNSFLFLAYKTK